MVKIFLKLVNINNDLKTPIDSVLKKVLTEYCRYLIKDIVVNK